MCARALFAERGSVQSHVHLPLPASSGAAAAWPAAASPSPCWLARSGIPWDVCVCMKATLLLACVALVAGSDELPLSAREMEGPAGAPPPPCTVERSGSTLPDAATSSALDSPTTSCRVPLALLTNVAASGGVPGGSGGCSAGLWITGRSSRLISGASSGTAAS